MDQGTVITDRLQAGWPQAQSIFARQQAGECHVK
jgi:hypothetical protein